MGNCCTISKAVDTVPLTSLKKGIENQTRKLQPASTYNVMISYCWADQELCLSLANRLIDDHFSVWIDREKMKGDIYSSMANAIDNSDCILVCMSESYFHSANCQREARYAADRNVRMIPIVVSQKYKPEKWLALIIAGKLYYKLEPSMFSFDLAYDKIKEEILQNTILDNSKRHVIRVLPSADDEKIRRIAYDKKFVLQVESDKQKTTKLMAEILQILKNKSDMPDDTIVIFNRVSIKYPKLTWQNFPPFASTGDINDAFFELPCDIKEDPSRFLRPFLKKYRAFVVGGQVALKKNNKMNFCDNKDLTLNTSEVKRDIQNEAHVFFMKLVERRSKPFDTGLPVNGYAWATINGFIGAGLKSDHEIEHRKQLDTDLELKKSRREELSSYFKTSKDCFCLFAARMKQNIIDFEIFLKVNSQ